MKTMYKRFLSMMLCICLMVGITIPAHAASVEFAAVISETGFTVKDTVQYATVTISANEVFSTNSFEFEYVVPDGWSATVALHEDVASMTATPNPDQKFYSVYATANVENVDALAVITYEIPANAEAKDYTVGVEALYVTNKEGIVADMDATTTLSISDDSGNDEGDDGTTSAYTAALNSITTEVAVDDTVTVNVEVASTRGDTAFNAAEFVLTYPTDKLELVAPAQKYKVDNGTLTVEDFGADKNFGTDAYTVQFKAIADGIAEVTLTNAAFVNKANANKTDLISADIAAEDATVEIEISKKTFDVTLPKDTDGNVIVEGETTVTDGEDYTFTLPDTDKYEYDVENMKVTVNGEEVDVKEVDGEYVIENVTGPVVIEGITREYRSYNVTFAGNAADEVTDGALTATYNTPYTFTKPSAENFNYTVSITIGGTAYTGHTADENGLITIPGDAILGDIVITVDKEQTVFTAEVTGTGAGAATIDPTNIDKNGTVTLTITPLVGYKYNVSATMGGQNATVVDNGDNTYTITGVNGNVVFTVEAILVVDGVAVYNYLTLDGEKTMFLVVYENTLEKGTIPAYDGKEMFWSEKYGENGAYCYLAEAATLDAEAAKVLVSTMTGEKKPVDYGMDVNKSGKVDAADAQYVYNMYNTMYAGVDTVNTVEKFLRADLNGDMKIYTEDAEVIIDYLVQ